MKYDELVKAVEERAATGDREEAERTLRVVLQALSDRLLGGEADDLLAQLPEPLKSEIRVTARADPMDPMEFVLRVADELDLPVEEARHRVRAVFGVLREAVTEGEFEDVLAELDRSYGELIPGA
jgi:uncharacterized protein (DUF2267 family)